MPMPFTATDVQL